MHDVRKQNILFLYLSMASLLAWMSLLLIADLLKALGLLHTVPWTLTTSWLQIQLAAWGFAGAMIFGMAYVLIPSFLGKNLAVPSASLLHLILAAASVPLFAISIVASSTAIWRTAASLWLAGSILFVANLILTRRTPMRPSVRKEKPSTFEDRLGLLMVSAAMAYLIASSFLFLQFDLQRGTGSLLPLNYWSNLHLYLLGFVVMMIFGVSHNLLPRFLGSRPNRHLLYINAVAALPVPLLFALFIAPGGLGFAIGGGLFALAFLGYALDTLLMYRDRRREVQTTFTFLLLSLLFLSVGIGFGILFILRPSLRYLSVIHAELNLFGFVGMTIFGVSYYIFPYFPKNSFVPSYTRPKVHLILSSGGLSLAVTGKLHGLLTGGGYQWIAVVGETMMLAGVLLYISCMNRMLTAIWRVVPPGQARQKATREPALPP